MGPIQSRASVVLSLLSLLEILQAAWSLPYPPAWRNFIQILDIPTTQAIPTSSSIILEFIQKTGLLLIGF